VAGRWISVLRDLGLLLDVTGEARLVRAESPYFRLLLRVALPSLWCWRCWRRSPRTGSRRAPRPGACKLQLSLAK
jgi:hypothetical protein